MPLVFQYGSNLSSDRINSAQRLCGAARIVGLARTVERFHLDFTVWSRQNGCAAADLIETPAGRSIWGILYDIPPERVFDDAAAPGVRSLDAIEGGNYRREEVAVCTATGPVGGPVLTYRVRERKSGVRTELGYVAHLFRGLREHAAPEEYVEYAKARVLLNNPALAGSLVAL